ncbi:MAG TPA: malto-oligosyltrehalose synthase, partial [Polyangiales bacterium]
HSFEALDRLLCEQNYRLASWRVAAEEINYRRFFDINQLAAIRMEWPQVFEHAHEKLATLLHEGKVQALRLDHTDGLYDPRGYFEQLQRRFVNGLSSPDERDNPDDRARPLPLLVEKILEPHEPMRSDWAVDGTTGYEFGNAVLGLWVDPAAERTFTQLYRETTGDARSFQEHVYEAKRLVLKGSFASQVNMMAQTLVAIASGQRRHRDFTWGSLKRALVETLAAFPVYRTYLREGEPVSDVDLACIESAIREARGRDPELDPGIFHFLQELLTLRHLPSREEQADHTRFALRFQQLTGPVTAKAVEDTAFYRYGRFICLNEVGGLPSKFGANIDEFHGQNATRARSFPLSMVSASTHDSKRGEDAAARLAVLSEMPQRFRACVQRLRALMRADTGEGSPRISSGDEYLFYQTAFSTWPLAWDGEHERGQLSERLVAT